ncbi:MAG: ribonuclease [Rhodospirillales bacterium]|nr:ribonuclease [Rhodospirillales bacterium]
MVSAHFRTTLVNGRQGDPAVLLEMPQRRHAMLFDAGDLAALSMRAALNVTHVFLSHGHLDHLFGFDRLLRVNIGREQHITIHGPPGTIAHIGHRLRGYEWDLVDRIVPVLRFTAYELHGDTLRATTFILRDGFEPEALPDTRAPGGLLLDAPGLTVRAAALIHHGPVLAFRAEASAMAVIDADAVAVRGWSTGPWVAALKPAALAGADAAETPGGLLPLATLGDVVRVLPGASLAYVTDVADTPANRAGIIALAQGVDTLFIEAPFLAAEAERAQARGHLTARAAGEIACAAGVARVEPFHFSARHEQAVVLAEVEEGFGRQLFGPRSIA